jgi:hypothetical protein
MSNSKSQINCSNEIKTFVGDLELPANSETLIKIRDRMFPKLEIRPFNEKTAPHEKAIRWKRTASEILNDYYVYQGKACTDLVVLFISFCLALGLETRFVKLRKAKMVHSVAEIKLSDGWYIFDVSYKNSLPVKGEITSDAPFKDWQLWKKGRDAWDLGLEKFEDIDKIKV